MGNVLAGYESLIRRYLDGGISVDEFRAAYFDLFKNEGALDKAQFELLDELFGDLDSFTTDPTLLAERPDFYLDEAKLREKAQVTAALLHNSSSRRAPPTPDGFQA